MAIVKMLRMEVVAPKSGAKSLIAELTGLSCVEISRPKAVADGFQAVEPRVDEMKQQLQTVNAAIDVFSKRFPVKKPLLSPKPEISEQELVGEDRMPAFQTADRVRELMAKLRELDSADVADTARKEALAQWTGTEIPLSYEGTAHVLAERITFPFGTRLEEVQNELDSKDLPAELIAAGESLENVSAWLIAYRKDSETVWQTLKDCGGMRALSLSCDTSSVSAIASLDRQMEVRNSQKAQIEQELAKCAEMRPALERCADALSVLITRETVGADVLQSRNCVVFDGWTPAERKNDVEAALERAGCAFELREPTEDENAPTAFKSNRFSQPFSILTEMYGMPAYNSLIDPNPVMAPFFLLFFGMMMADVGYGLLVAALALVATKKMQPRGTIKDLFHIVFWGGLSMALWGVFYGSYFGDVVTQISKNFLGSDFTIPALLMDPMTQPLYVLILSFGLGLIHIMVGMGVSAYRQILRGKWFDAVCDTGFWYLVFVGLILMVLGVQVGTYLALAGVAGMLIFGGRHASNFMGKITGGLSQLYSVTGYLSDILSYSRLLALGLSSAIVASVFNILGTLVPGVAGIIVFIPVFLFGHVFNLAINILGAFVHSLRLQYIEFFGKFYEDGGRPFKPAVYRTKNYYLK